jgi:hypothetical protein
MVWDEDVTTFENPILGDTARLDGARSGLEGLEVTAEWLAFRWGSPDHVLRATPPDTGEQWTYEFESCWYGIASRGSAARSSHEIPDSSGSVRLRRVFWPGEERRRQEPGPGANRDVEGSAGPDRRTAR